MKALVIILCVIAVLFMVFALWCSLAINKYDLRDEYLRDLEQKSIDKKNKK